MFNFELPTNCGPSRTRTGDLFVANEAFWPAELSAQSFSVQKNKTSSFKAGYQKNINPLNYPTTSGRVVFEIICILLIK